MIPGIEITMGGREWTIPPLTLGQLRRLMPKVRQLSEINAQMGETQIAVLVEIVAAALQRIIRISPPILSKIYSTLEIRGRCSPRCRRVQVSDRQDFPRGKRWPPGLARGQACQLRRELERPLWRPRNRLRIQLFGNRWDDPLRGRRAYLLLDRPSAASPLDCGLSREAARQTSGLLEIAAGSRRDR